MERILRTFAALSLVALLPMLGGCPISQSQDTPVAHLKMTEPSTGESYYIYVPSNYTAERQWPLVISLHGTIPWDTYLAQIMEWKALAEEKGFIVVCPYLKSSQGIIKTARESWYQDLDTDERVILAVMDDVCGKYHVDPKAVLLTGFSAGGFSMYYTGMRNPKRFSALIGRACNSDVKMLEEKVELTDDVRKLPVVIFWGSDDPVLRQQGWDAFEYLRIHQCKNTIKHEIRGGHLRRPDLAWQYWLPYLDPQYRNPS